MRHQKALAVTTIILFFTLTFTSFSAAEITVGVKKGDWIEYVVSYQGTPAQGHDITFARMDITDVSGPEVSVIMTSQFADHTESTLNSTLNLKTGHLIDVFIIPANLNVGDSFKDENLGELTIQATRTGLYAGVERPVLTSNVGENTYIWDQSTGVSLEGVTQTANYTLHTIVSSTNLWQPQPTITGAPDTFDFTAIVLVFSFGTIVLAFALLFSARYIRKKAFQRRQAM